jgi:putative membrane protein
MDFLARLIISTLAVMVTSFLLPGVNIDSAITAVLVAFVLSLLNAVIKPLLILLTIPITIFTLGIFLLVINALIIQLAGWIVPGFEVNGFWTAFFFSIVLSLITTVVEGLAKNKD